MNKKNNLLKVFGIILLALFQLLGILLNNIGYCVTSNLVNEKEISIPAVPEKLDSDNNKIWIKAELHQHYLYDISLPELLKLYKDEKYNFIIIALKDTEKEYFPEQYSTDELLVIEGVEQAFKSFSGKFLHFNAFRMDGPFRFTDFWTVEQGLKQLQERNKDVILMINHPADKKWEMEDLKNAVENGAKLFELNSDGDAPIAYAANLWDKLLSERVRTWGVLSNDHRVPQMLFIEGFGYIVIQSEKLAFDSIRNAILNGAFYASEHHHKAKVKKYIPDIDKRKIYLEVDSDGKNKIRFIGKNGNILMEKSGNNAVYKVKGDEMYIRAEVIDSDGRILFLQPVFLPK